MRCLACHHDNRDAAKFCEECAAPLTRLCVNCGSELRPTAKFCDECGLEIRALGAGGYGVRVPSSGGDLKPLTPNPATPNPVSSDARKVVTILFADLAGSTALQERLDPESARAFMERYYRAMRAAVDANGGTVVKLLGDGVMAAFGVPRVAEDDAIRAVRAGVAMQASFRALAGHERDIGLRVAVNTGEVVVSNDDSDVVGDPVNVAARLQQEAHDGEVVIGEATSRLVASLLTLAPLGSFALKGRTESVKAYRVESLDRPAGAAAAAFVGRDAELARITAVYDAAVAAPHARLAVLLGSPGLGKSRLINELTRRLGDAATVLTAQCDATGGATFAPLAEALRTNLSTENVPLLTKEGLGEVGVSPTLPPPGPLLGKEGEMRAAIEAIVPGTDTERARIVAGITALLAGSPASPEETFFVIRRLLSALALVKPVVLVIDDLHWAEPLLLDLVEHLVQWGSGVPLLVLVGARPELRDTRSSLTTTAGLVADVVTLSGLDAGAATRLAANVIGAADLPAAVAAKVLATSEGNPLFVGELVRMLVQEGALTKEGDRWTAGAGLAALEMPPTIHALLAARIERLRPGDRTVLERAAVVGRHFSRSALAALLPRETIDLDARLEALKRSELIEPDSGWFLGEPVLRFHHVLIRDAAYRRVLKGTRAELHGRLADWIESRTPDAIEHDETIGWHLEQAHQHLRELGPIDDNGRRLGERASTHLAAAGRRALARDDLPVAANLLGRAIERLDAADPARAELALDWCEALLAAGDVGPAAKAIGELGKFIDDAACCGSLPLEKGGQEGFPNGSVEQIPLGPPFSKGEVSDQAARLRAWHICFTGHLTALTDPQALHATADAVAAAAEQLAALGDAAGEAKAHQVHAQALARLGKVGACEAALDRALAAARRAGDRRRANAVLAGAPIAALWGPSPVTRASGRCLDVVRVLRITQGAPAVEAVALSCQGVLEALRGRTDAARRMIASSRKMVEELGIAHRLFEADAFAGRIELLEGDAVAAERSLRGAYEGLRDLGLGIDAACAAALLARALLAQGKAAEAEALSRESEALAGDDLQAAIAWRGVRAEALAQRGEHGAAVELAQAAVTIAAATDALLDHADARLALAAALRAAGRSGEADAENRRASELWEAKGATLLAERVRHAEKRIEAVPTEARAEATCSVQRRVRGNAATAAAARFDAAFAAGDISAIEAWFSNAVGMRVIDHPTESTYGRAGSVDSYRRLLRLKDPVVRHEPLATLGKSLGLFRRGISADGTTGGRFDVGDFQREEFTVTEPDVLIEIFAADRLADAIVRLYQRHAKLLPERTMRRRAEATASSVARMLAVAASRSVDQLPAALSPTVESIDHGQLGLPPGRGADELIRDVRALFDLAADLRIECTDVLRLEANALLHHLSMCGTDRRSGGLFEFPVLLLWLFDDDGLLARWEVFDPERPAQAVARFDELTGSGSLPLEKGGQEGFVESSAEQMPLDPPLRQSSGQAFSKEEALRRRVRPNAAGAVMARMEAAFAARDLDMVAGLLGESMENVDHPTESAYGREGQIESSRRMMRTPGLEFRIEVLATLGDALCLIRRLVTASGTAGGAFDVGEYEMEHVGICELDQVGRCRSFEVFAADHLGDAVARLYGRYAELLPDGPARVRATAIAGSLANMVAPPDLERYAAALAQTVDFVDHRTVGFASGRGADKLLRGFRSLFDFATDIATRVDDVLALEAGAVLLRWTTSGTDRAGGGPFESTFLLLWQFGADGLVVHDETFDAGREAEALARFDELASQIPLVPPFSKGEAESVRRVRANAATHGLERFESALRERDVTALKDVFHQSLHVVHHSTRATYGRREMVGAWRSVIKAERFEFRSQILASLGGALALEHHFLALEGLSEDDVPEMGRAEFDEIALIEADDRGRWLHCEIFAADRLGDAVARLYDLYAALVPDGPQRERATATARSVAAFADSSIDVDLLAAAMTPDFEQVDHRNFATWSVSGAGPALEHYRALHAVADEVTFLIDDMLAARPDALLAQRTHTGTDRQSGGRSERVLLYLFVAGADGQAARVEFFEADREAEALARFDELAGSTSPTEADRLFFNAARRAVARFERSWAARDWDGVTAMYAPTYSLDDRRSLMHLQVAGEAFLDHLRMLFLAVPGSCLRFECLATRGERLALHRGDVEGEIGDGGGPFSIGALQIDEVDAGGRSIASIVFDPTDLDAAYAEVDRRYEAGDGAAHPAHRAVMRAFTDAVASRDWEPVLALCAPAFVEYDHRGLAVLGTTRGAAAWAENFRTLVDLAPDTIYRVDHFRSGARGFCSVGTWHGSREGGPYEIPLVAVLEMDERDRLARADIYDLDQLDQALARFAELADVRFLPLKKGGQEGFVQSSGAQIPLDPPFSKGEGQRFANAATATVDPVIACMVAHDWEGFAQLFSEDFRISDRRRVVQLELDRDQYVAFTREVADGRAIRAHSEVIATRGELLALTRPTYVFTDADVGPSEIVFLILTEVDDRGRIIAYVRWDVEDLDAAYAELDARWAAGAGEPLGQAHVYLAELPERFANIAARAVARWERSWTARDWVAVTGVYAPTYYMDDRRSLMHMRLAGEAFFEHLHMLFLAVPGSRLRFECLATRGEDLVLNRGDVEGEIGDGGGPFSIGALQIDEVDAGGRSIASIVFDPTDLDAAYAELDTRWAAGEAAAHPLASQWVGDYQRCFAARDWEGMAALTAPDLVLQSHRLVSWGTLQGPAGLVSTLQAQIELAPDTQVRVDHVRTCAGGVLLEYAWHGTRDGGDFENLLVAAIEIDALGRARRIDVWEAEQLEQAQARFEAIRSAEEASGGDSRSGPLRIPPNAATRWNDRWCAFGEARDWEALRALCAPDMVFDDRRRLLRTTGDREMALVNGRAIWESGRVRLERTLLATAGDRLVLELWGGRDPGADFEIDLLALTEVDTDNLVVAWVCFDPDDRAAAHAELLERYAASGAHEMLAAWFEFVRAWNAHDLGRLRILLPGDYFFHDHRRTGIGRVKGDAYIASLAALYELSPDVRLEPLYGVARAAHGRVGVMRWVGTNAEGGEFEAVFVGLSLYRGEHLVGAELFEIDDFDAALARFAELGAL